MHRNNLCKDIEIRVETGEMLFPYFISAKLLDQGDEGALSH